MMTPQEVASHAFSKATLGGYNMAMVDEFLDLLTEDYTTLYNDNTILKNKLKVLSETVEEYRATDAAIRKTLLAAQQLADSMVKDAEQKQATLLQGAEADAHRRLESIRKEIEAEESRLKDAKAATAAYVQKVADASSGLVGQLAALRELAAVEEEVLTEEAPVEEAPAAEITYIHTIPVEEVPEEAEPAAVTAGDDDLSATRRFENLQFGKDYEIR